ncbi:hypothetical protein [Hyphomicrobium sp.]|uniref:hypothetical protein n=1 Tax=Hyphomicrobium sp. TaxID=82 RepID=UPI0025C11CA3|nr:hypothetical protein [Hyphomicrobium sp.]
MMKYIIAPAFAALCLSAATTLAIAEDQSATDRARHTFGEEGKLPPSGAVNSRVPEMGAGTGTGEGTAGTSHRMGDEGKLPATNSMTNQVPKMSTPKSPDTPDK